MEAWLNPSSISILNICPFAYVCIAQLYVTEKGSQSVSKICHQIQDFYTPRNVSHIDHLKVLSLAEYEFCLKIIKQCNVKQCISAANIDFL